MIEKITPTKKIAGSLAMPGDKSISHRALMLSAIARGNSEITGLSRCRDVMSTLQCLQHLGVKIDISNVCIQVEGKGLRGLRRPREILDAGNSGTTMRLLTGILAGQHFESRITGDASLKRRPMKRIIEPLKNMGAKIAGREGKFAPLMITPNRLKCIRYQLPVASAQVKSCILLAGLFADGETTVIEPNKSRDHTELMLDYLGAEIQMDENVVSLTGQSTLQGSVIHVPGDISSAAFFIIAATLVKGSGLTIRGIGINQTRTGILDVLSQMGGCFESKNVRMCNNEKIADIEVYSSELKGIEMGGAMIPRIIDEIPILAVAATQATGATVIRDAQELRVKESDRIAAVIKNLKNMGATVTELSDGMIIEGSQKLTGAHIYSGGDHRIAMAFAVAGLIARGETVIHEAECADISHPGFFDQLRKICHD